MLIGRQPGISGNTFPNIPGSSQRFSLTFGNSLPAFRVFIHIALSRLADFVKQPRFYLVVVGFVFVEFFILVQFFVLKEWGIFVEFLDFLVVVFFLDGVRFKGDG